VREPVARLRDLREDPAQLAGLLELAQVGGVRRGDVDRRVARERVDLLQAGDVVVGGAFERRVLVLAEVDAEDAVVLRAPEVLDEAVDADRVEAEPVDDRRGVTPPISR
jgi:hypothetical protein